MTKELIISANVHEKKVAIIEDGVVSEFYVERSDENQGVVGNLYKGRVMKVLPGMQSAFVDIALERDAFLYVSDFAELMEDEDLIEFKEGVEAKPAAGRPKPRFEDPRDREQARPGQAGQPPFPRQGRRDFPPQAKVEALVEEPDRESAEAEAAYQQSARMQDVVEQLAEIVVERVIPPPQREEDLDDGSGDQPLSSAPGIGEEEQIEPASVETLGGPEAIDVAEVEAADAEVEPAKEKPEKGRSRRRGPARSEPPKPQRKPGKKPDKSDVGKDAADTSGPAAKRGSRRRPTAAEDESEAVASDRESASAEGSWESEAAAEARFQRVTDDDMAQMAGEMLKDAMVQEKIIERVHNAEYQIVQPQPPPEIRVGTLRSKLTGDSRFQRVKDEEEAVLSSASEPPAAFTLEEDAPPRARAASGWDAGGYGQDQGRSGSSEGEGSGEGREVHRFEGGGSEGYGAGEAEIDSSASGQSGSDASDARPKYEDDEDGEASVHGGRGIAEFAIRRGGRGRRRRREPPAQGDEARPRTDAVPAEGEVV
ncbi:MAG TPA: hypothetical protein VLZ81_16540, partial [Blastocatellia bacterium]|nr:hypothetical protein [Blastocatellia bacterium]